ncbi:MAG: Helix-turn-helix domain [Pseudomonadota bacterium]|jgi:predicted DNA-binding transcriptional regulator AlpA
MTDLTDRLLTSEEVETMLGVSQGWCAKDRISTARIPFCKIGKSVRYTPASVQAFIDASMRRSTSDPQIARTIANMALLGGQK